MTIALRSGFQRLRVQALVAVFLATQFWEWYPLFHVVVKAFEPTALLLLQSYNPYVRYAAALIAGLINAGRGDAALGEALLKLMEDNVGLVNGGEG